jgi:hypothetical protein
LTTSAIAIDPGLEVAPKPDRIAIWAIALAGCAVAIISLVLALTNDAIGLELGEPLVIALLADWIIVAYVFGGLLAWMRRPTSRLGPLMITAGFVMFATTLSWSERDIAYTIGQSLDLVAPVLFLHVYLAFPDGRLHGAFERALVATAYAVAIVAELTRMSLGGFGPHNLLEVTSRPDTEDFVRRFQLLTVATLCLCGVGVLVYRRWQSGRPLRRASGLIVDAFALGLVMIAALLVSLTFGWPWARELRWATFVTLGLAPVAFVFVLARARLAQSAVGELVVELRSEPEPAALRDALARALGDPSVALAYWLPAPALLPPDRGGASAAARLLVRISGSAARRDRRLQGTTGGA